jgi:hypothetical protein
MSNTTGDGLSPEGAAFNSQGREPLVRTPVAKFSAPKGRH